jgi:hypothetical protein
MPCDIPPEETGIIEIPDSLNLDFYNPMITPGPVTGSERRIKLTWEVSRYFFHSTDGIRVRITATDQNLMPDKVFAYLMLPMRPGGDVPVGMFDHVCSPVDLEEYPEDEPLPNARPAWFRLEFVDVLLRSRAEVDAFIRDVVEDVQRLKNTLDTADNLLPGGNIWIGNPPDEE